MRQTFKTYQVNICPLTPIHVGTGNEVVPGEYFLFSDKDKDVNLAYIVDIADIACKLDDKNREMLIKWIEENPETWLRNFKKNDAMRGLVRENYRFKCKVSQKSYNAIKERWNNTGSKRSELAISMTHRSIKGPFIPGSSVKGCLRTALLYSKYRKVPNKLEVTSGDDPYRWERRLFDSESDGSVESDIFKYLKISDFASTVNQLGTKIYQTHFVKMRDMPDFRECIRKYNECEGLITIVNARFSARGIIDACNRFYSEVLKRERNYWNMDEAIGHDVLHIYDNIDIIRAKNPDAALIRIGWGVGMSSISLNLAKSDPPNDRDAKNPLYYRDPITRRLFDSKFPPGWALMTIEN